MKARQSGDQILFLCPGCKSEHAVNTTWTFNGNFERPTFAPSVLLRTGHFISTFKAGDSCWCTYDAAHPEAPSGFACVICHSFVTDGRIQYLGDCTHAMAGQTVELPEIAEVACD